MKRLTYLLLIICAIMLCQAAYGQTAKIEIDESGISGFWKGLDTIRIDADIYIPLRYTCDYDCSLVPTNAFKIWTTDGATWSGFAVTSLCQGGFCNGFDDILIQYGPEGNDGPPQDEVAVGGVVTTGTGWATPYDDIPFAISFHSGTKCGTHIMLDMTEFNGIEWLWTALSCDPPQGDIVPDWGGPYVFVLFDYPGPPVECNYPSSISSGHCAGFTCDIDCWKVDPHPEPPLNSISYTCDLGEIDSNGVWTWVADDSCIGQNTYVTITATADDGYHTSMYIGLEVDYNYAPEFMAGYEESYSAQPGVAVEAVFSAIDYCPGDPRNYFVADDGGCAGSYYFTDSVLTFIPDESDCALWPVTMTIGVEDTRDSSLCEVYFYVIADDCCEGYRGDANCSGDDNPDISDITRLIDYLYLSSSMPLCCPEEADANGSGGDPDISDITALIDFLYLSHTPLAMCEAVSPYPGVSSNGSCLDQTEKDGNATEDCVEYNHDGDMTLSIAHHNTSFNCCIEGTYIELSFSGDTLYITERENLDNGGCDCICLYDINYSIYNLLPGAYTISIDELYYGEDIIFDVELQSQPSGSYCVERFVYPWGY